MEIVQLQVMLIDDDPIVNMINRKMLEINAPHVNTNVFESAKNALTFIQHQGIENTLVLLDINMPEMDGWQFLKELENRLLITKPFVIMLTSSIDMKDRERSMTSPLVRDFISKPLTKDSILNRLMPAISGS